MEVQHSPLVLYLASTSSGKLREFSEAAKDPISVRPLPAIDDLPRCLEDGATFEQNARKKALHYSAYLDQPIFADDSGLCVDALSGAPGVYSARFAALAVASASLTGFDHSAGAGAAAARAGRGQRDNVAPGPDAANNARLLRELEGVPGERRTAHYVCAIAL